MRDDALDALLNMDGQTFVVTSDARYWVKFEVKQVPVTPERPHGLDYSLTLHGPNSGRSRDSRLVGFDNAHAVANSGPAKRVAFDHKHRLRTVQHYDYADAGTLLADFWHVVDGVFAERGEKME